jgi:ADP-heptose:LPS heptosyltransferase
MLPFSKLASAGKAILVITPDTAIAHLAGALGARVWTVLSYVPDWRWLLEGEDTPWYPTMRLFRQREPQCWDDPFAHIKDELMKLRHSGD